MRIIEIVAAELADKLVEGGTQFQMEPDHVLWPDGTTTKKPSPVHGKKTKKVPPAVSKHGLYGTIVAQFGNKKKTNAVSNTVATSNVVTFESPQSTPSSTGQAKSTSTPEKPKQSEDVSFKGFCSEIY